jgi:phospholipase C
VRPARGTRHPRREGKRVAPQITKDVPAQGTVVKILRLVAVATFILSLGIAIAPARASLPLSSLWTSALPNGSVVPDARKKQLKKLQHLIFILQENRSFDHYFGTYPKAQGFPSPLPCLPSTWYPSKCFTPYVNHTDKNNGGRHEHQYQVLNIDGGKMDGFVETREGELQDQGCPPPNKRPPGFIARVRTVDDEGVIEDTSKCPKVDVMGYHDGTDLPNYWAYAQNFVLEDQYHESIVSWSQPSHFMVFSGWAAKCTQLNPPDVNSCSDDWTGLDWSNLQPTPDLWTDITYLLWQHDITWAAYLDGGQGGSNGYKGVLSSWNSLPGFQTVQEDGQVAQAETNLTQFYSDAANGTLPQVSWIMPKEQDSEHPTAKVSVGQTYVTKVLNAIMASPEWSSTAVFLSWDDPDGFYDHVPPTYIDAQGYGVRSPAMVISPYSKPGYIDHQLCTSDCYLKLIEDVFLGSERMSEAGRPDPRPDYRDAEATGDLTLDFDFKQKPRAPLFLPEHPMTLLTDNPNAGDPPPSAIHDIARYRR